MEASVKAASGASESNGLSMLDIAKHAVRTVIKTLDSKDRLCLVQFCRVATLVMPLTYMDEAGKSLAGKYLDEMTFGNGTALWQGLYVGLEELHRRRSQDRSCPCLSSMMLLTDGETEDNETVIQSLEEAKTRYGGQLPGPVNVFGFGYEIDSPLLVKVASIGGGAYGFIPDAGFVGTIFVNAISTVLATCATDAVLKVEGTPSEVLGGWELSGGQITLGSLQYGQSKDVVLVLSDASPDIKVTLEYSALGGKRVTLEATPLPPDKAIEVDIQLCRSRFVDVLGRLPLAVNQDRVESGQQLLKDFAQQVSASPAAADEKVKGLLEDALGQCVEAVAKPEYWQRWGRHYLPSVMFAHRLQQCNNFKDPGVQFYGNDLFADIRDIADTVFNKLAPPTITPARYRYHGAGNLTANPDYDMRSLGAGGGSSARSGSGASAPAYRPSPPPVSMAAYNDASAG